MSPAELEVGLPSIVRFFELLDSNRISYVQWKSNARLPEFMNGVGDLDLLFESDERSRVEQILQSIQAKKFEALPVGKYPNIEDYLAVDGDTGLLIHFHIHYGLDIGEPELKRYSLPWTSEILENRIRHESQPVWIPRHEDELLLLFLREALRIPFYAPAIRNRRWMISAKSRDEYHWLKKRLNPESFSRLIRSRLGVSRDIDESIQELYHQGLEPLRLFRFRKALRTFRNEYGTVGDFRAAMRIVNRKVARYIRAGLKPFTGYSPGRRINPNGGMIVVFIGSDGAGKTTAIERVVEEYRKKLDVQSLYFGLPKPSKSSFPAGVRIIRRLGLFPLFSLHRKRMQLRAARRLQKQGVLVLCDRFPQPDYDGIMDGPLLSGWAASGNPIKRVIARLEKRVLNGMKHARLDLVIKLLIDAETSQTRGGLPIETARRKTEIVRKLTFPNAGSVMELDAIAQNEEAVSRQAIFAVWNRMP